MASKEISKFDEIIKKSILIADSIPARYHLSTKTDSLDQSAKYKRTIFGERDKNKPHKIILLVGETGTGKTKLINTVINYMLGVQREDKVWFEITDDQSDQSTAHSQTSIITVYEVYLQESPIDLTIIDTPGYGDTRGVDLDKKITMSLISLSESEKEINAIDAVCLVIMAQQNRLSDRQIYIFDAVQSLFGRDIAENIVLLFTHSTGAPPKNALTAVEEAQIKCAVNEQKNQPVFFLFDNCQSDAHDEEYEMIQERSWNLSFRGMTGLFDFLDTIQPKTLKMTQDVSQKWNQLETSISNLRSCVQMKEQKQIELKGTQEALEQNKQDAKENNNFEYEVEVPYKERVAADPKIAKEATCCTNCQENCHYSDTWTDKIPFLSALMKDDHCTVCPKKCHYSKHVREAKIYVTKTKKEKRINNELKKENDKKIYENTSFVKLLEEELQQLEIKKAKLAIEAFHCVETLQLIGLNTDSLFILQHVDFLIEMLKQTDEPEKAKVLEDIKSRAEERKHRALGWINTRTGLV